jgi:hypothetical protein
MIHAMSRESEDEADFKTLVASDPAMRRYVVAFARRAKELRGFALGLYVEALVAHELGATLSPGGTDDADIEWRPSTRGRPIKIQVRSCRLRDAPRGVRGSVDVGKADHRAQLGDVWVFAVHSGNEHRSGWRFLARSANELEEFGAQRRVAVGRLGISQEWIEPDGLAEAVRAASRR